VTVLSESDLDRLADYTAGLLEDGDAAEVARLVATDPGWADAYAALTAAQPALDEALASLAPGPVPPDVVARLDRALADAADDATSGAHAGTAAKVVRLSDRRRGWRVAAGVVAAAAVVAACFGGVTVLQHNGGTQSTKSSAGRAQSDSAGAGSAVTAPQLSSPGPAVTASGVDYTHATLGQAGAYSAKAPAAAGNNADELAVPQGLALLSEPVARSACLAAIVTADGGTPTSVDYARYQGRPALIVVLTGGTKRVVAAGPTCGQPGAGSAEIDSVDQ
jgi:anti-sigma factor RsiW